jgi:hypothetical protein
MLLLLQLLLAPAVPCDAESSSDDRCVAFPMESLPDSLCMLRLLPLQPLAPAVPCNAAKRQ